jgi:hypothetical protein
VAQADRDAGRRSDGLTTAEREELSRLRRENRVLREEREAKDVVILTPTGAHELCRVILHLLTTRQSYSESVFDVPSPGNKGAEYFIDDISHDSGVAGKGIGGEGVSALESSVLISVPEKERC